MYCSTPPGQSSGQDGNQQAEGGVTENHLDSHNDLANPVPWNDIAKAKRGISSNGKVEGADQNGQSQQAATHRNQLSGPIKRLFIQPRLKQQAPIR